MAGGSQVICTVLHRREVTLYEGMDVFTTSRPLPLVLVKTSYRPHGTIRISCHTPSATISCRTASATISCHIPSASISCRTPSASLDSVWNLGGHHFSWIYVWWMVEFWVLPFTLIYFCLATIINLIISNVSRLLCKALQTWSKFTIIMYYWRWSKFTIIHFMTELYQKDLLGSVHSA